MSPAPFNVLLARPRGREEGPAIMLVISDDGDEFVNGEQVCLDGGWRGR